MWCLPSPLWITCDRVSRRASRMLELPVQDRRDRLHGNRRGSLPARESARAAQ